ncbi:transposase [Natronoglomus mannanivorans]|uniref:Transposase n=1 Tax=Natronoglomus mannanivorans TaxID=2979990 RepID=A0AAP3E1C6_9EURY|nr:transposase [Halobacteria archaeon AArc-xg1-1]
MFEEPNDPFNTSYRYAAYPDEATAREAHRHIDIHRQIRNHALYDKRQADPWNEPSEYTQHKRLTQWKQEWPIYNEVHSKAAQRTITQLHRDQTGLDELTAKGYETGRLKWKPPREFNSVTYSQSGFELRKKSGQTYVWLSKIGEIPINYHRELPDEYTIKEVALKQEPTGDWFVSFSVDKPWEDMPEKPAVEDIDEDDMVGIDLGVLSFAYTSDGVAYGRVDLDKDYERLAREQRKLQRKDEGSNNYEKQRVKVARVKRRIRRRVLDYQRKLALILVSEYDLIFLEDLSVKEMLESDQSAKNKQDVAWAQFRQILTHAANKHGVHVVPVDARGTTIQCAGCDTSVWKPIWIREHSCPTCGLEVDRDQNASWNVLQDGVELVNAGEAEADTESFGCFEAAYLGNGLAEVTPAETATAVLANGGSFEPLEVSASRVVESGSPTRKQGSPTLNERATAVVASE